MLSSYFQWQWISGQAHGKSHWPRRHSNVQNIKYTSQSVKIYTELLESATSTNRIYSGYKYNDPMDMTNSLLSVGKEWTALIDDLIDVVGPIPGKNCTLSLLNPLTGSLEWLSVDCHQKYSISTLVCERVREDINIINVLFVDLTSYIELHETSFKDTRLLNSCPDQLYVMFCAHGGFSPKQIINNQNNKCELPAHQVRQFKMIKYSRNFTGYHLFDKTPILSRLFEHACINKTYILLSASYKKPYGSFAHIGKIPYYGHFALCPISIHQKRYERHLSQMSASVVGIMIHAGLLSCRRGCIGLDNKCVCFDSVTHTTQTSLDQAYILQAIKTSWSVYYYL